MGECDFELFDKKGRLKIRGSYVNAKDTLIKYKSAVARGFESTGGKRFYFVHLIKYFSPFEKGTWTFYDEHGKITHKIDIDFSYGNFLKIQKQNYLISYPLTSIMN